MGQYLICWPAIELQTKKLIALDPNKGDLFYAVDRSNVDAKTFRYSQNQRRKETRKKVFAKLILQMKFELITWNNISRSVYRWESALGAYNSKSVQMNFFSPYIREKIRLNNILAEFYSRPIFRGFRLNAYRNVQKHEKKMIANFKEKFDIVNPEDCVLCFGDWNQRRQMRYHEPTKGVGLRDLFRRNGFHVYLVDEDLTSKKCSKCNDEADGNCIKFKYMRNPRPWRHDIRLVWGLVECEHCHQYWNRDANAATNIYNIASNAIQGLPRPQYLTRQ